MGHVADGFDGHSTSGAFLAFLFSDLLPRIANAIADGDIVDLLEFEIPSVAQGSGWLQDRMKELRAQASTAERAVADYKAKNNIVDAGGRLLTEQQLAEINSSLTIARGSGPKLTPSSNVSPAFSNRITTTAMSY